PDDPNRFNQALMELGALICTPKSPKCDICPVQNLCEAHLKNEEEQYPVKEKKVKKVEETYYVLIIEKEYQIGMVKRPEEGLLANLWGLPMVSEEIWEENEWDQLISKRLDPVTHIFTHRKWKMIPIMIKWSDKIEHLIVKLHQNSDQIIYIQEDDMKDLPIATAFKKVLKSCGLSK
ncbi:MAG: NUDIX domain-containing protein, partial [Candidatus Cellulosilyticum pullistercoris]|nr:NUDIX domain-containing protein [Candidatus Cellulosilyticum pullistercoris]